MANKKAVLHTLHTVFDDGSELESKYTRIQWNGAFLVIWTSGILLGIAIAKFIL